MEEGQEISDSLSYESDPENEIMEEGQEISDSLFYEADPENEIMEEGQEISDSLSYESVEKVLRTIEENIASFWETKRLREEFGEAMEKSLIEDFGEELGRQVMSLSSFTAEFCREVMERKRLREDLGETMEEERLREDLGETMDMMVPPFVVKEQFEVARVFPYVHLSDFITARENRLTVFQSFNRQFERIFEEPSRQLFLNWMRVAKKMSTEIFQTSELSRQLFLIWMRVAKKMSTEFFQTSEHFLYTIKQLGVISSC